MFYRKDGTKVFPIGMYSFPANDAEWTLWREAGVNLLRCGTRDQLDEAWSHGMFGWVSVPMVLAPGDDGKALATLIDSLKDHPALAVWEAPDEAIWNAWYDGRIPRRLWTDSPEEIAGKNRKMDELVDGLTRGAAIVRERDPGRSIWLNEAVLSPLDIVARCAGSLDIIGFDYYASGIPEDNFAWPMQLMGRDIDRFRAAAPNCAVWMIEQAFSYPELLPQYCSHFPGGTPSRDELRFMAWQAIHHGTTGLFWYGLHKVQRPTPFMDDLMAVVSELRRTVEFVENGPVPGIAAEAHHSWRPSIMGCSCTVWRLGDRMLVFMINEDAHSVDMHIRGLDDVVRRGLVPVNEPSADLTPLDGGYITPMRGHEVRLYLTG